MPRIGSLWRSTFVHYKTHGACVVQEHVDFQVLSIEPSPRSPESLQPTTTFFSCAGGRQGVQLFAERSRSDASNSQNFLEHHALLHAQDIESDVAKMPADPLGPAHPPKTSYPNPKRKFLLQKPYFCGHFGQQALHQRMSKTQL